MLPLQIDTAELMARAEKAISSSLASLAGSIAPKADMVLAEITFAYKLNLISYARRELLMMQAKSIAAYRASELVRLKNAPVVHPMEVRL